MSIPFVLSDTSLTVVLDGAPQAIPASHPSWAEILNLVQAPYADEDYLRTLIDVGKSIENFCSGQIVVENRQLTYAGKVLNTGLTRKIIQFMQEGKDEMIAPLVSFLDRVMQNPSHRAVNGLYDWVSRSGMPITSDGYILAWKIVDGDFMDYYSGTLDHTPGNVVKQPRNMCDEDPNATCSAGIHFCSFDYLPKYQNNADRRVLLVQIDPANVVAIPKEYGIAKGRCCELTVIREVPEDRIEHFFPKAELHDVQLAFGVGQIWETRDGDHVTIVNVNGHYSNRPIEGDDGYYRTLEGMWCEFGNEDEDDLIRFISAS